MKRRFLASAIQMTSGEDKQANLATARRLVRQAADAGATLVALPELFNCLGRPEVMLADAEPIPGPTSHALGELAKHWGITLLGGSFCERSNESEKAFNTSLLFAPDGRIVARYRKLHLFDIDLPGRVTFQESRWLAPGAQLVISSTELGRVGQAICYDLRFAEMFARLVDAGAEVICTPSAFTLHTGRDHWEILVRARAIENQVFVVAPNQYGRHSEQLVSYGRSMIVDPWGIPLAVAADGEGIIVAPIDLERLQEIRTHLPTLASRRRLSELAVQQQSPLAAPSTTARKKT